VAHTISKNQANAFSLAPGSVIVATSAPAIRLFRGFFPSVIPAAKVFHILYPNFSAAFAAAR